MKRVYKVKKCKEIFGTVNIPGSKNSSLGLLAASCLSNDKVILRGIPNIADVRVIKDLGKDIGLEIVNISENDLEIDPTKIFNTNLDYDKTSSFRASYYFVGSLLSKYKKISIGYPGGDDFGSRPIDQHIKGLKALGAEFLFFKNHFEVTAEELKGNEIFFDVITSGATINLILAAVLAKGRTILNNAAMDPEVVDVANMLNLMGAKIRGAGTSRVIIDGVESLGGCDYQVIPDRLIAAALMMTVGVSGGKIQLENIIHEHVDSSIIKLKEIGLDIEIEENKILVTNPGNLRSTDIKTGMYPGLPTDVQQPFTSLLLSINGKSKVTDNVYKKRFNHVPELRKMGADIHQISNTAIIKGGKPLYGTDVKATDVRAGTSLILAGMFAEGITTIHDIYHIERGYDDALSMFQNIGIDIRLEKYKEGINKNDVCRRTS